MEIRRLITITHTATLTLTMEEEGSQRATLCPRGRLIPDRRG